MKKIVIPILVLILLLAILCLKISVNEFFTNNSNEKLMKKALSEINKMCPDKNLNAEDLKDPTTIESLFECIKNTPYKIKDPTFDSLKFF